MPVIEEITTDSLTDLHNEPDPEPAAPTHVEPPTQTATQGRHVVRLTKNGHSKGLLSRRVMSREKAREMAERHNRQNDYGAPSAHVHRVSV